MTNFAPSRTTVFRRKSFNSRSRSELNFENILEDNSLEVTAFLFREGIEIA